MTKVVSKKLIDTRHKHFEELEKGDFFFHSGRMYIKTNPSVVSNVGHHGTKFKYGVQFGSYIHFNAVRIVDFNCPNKIGSRGSFAGNTLVVRVNELSVEYNVERGNID